MLVGRIRQVPGAIDALLCSPCGDNLRKGAALNAVADRRAPVPEVVVMRSRADQRTRFVRVVAIVVVLGMIAVFAAALISGQGH